MSEAAASRNALRLALAAAGVGGLICWLSYRLPPPSVSDFDNLHIATRGLLAGKDPYAAVVASGIGYPLFYPLPACLLVLPVAWLPLPLARVGWAALSAGVFTLAAQRYGRGLPVALLSAPFLNAIVLGQWSPLLPAAVAFPLLGCVWAAKPSLGAALFVSFPSRRALGSALAIVVLSLMILPGWPRSWLAALQASNHKLPILQPGGFLLGLALLRWRTREARLLLALACIPQTIGFYEVLPLFLIPRRRREAYLLAVLSYAAAFISALLFPWPPGAAIEIVRAHRWPVLLALVYLPTLVLVLAQRPALNAANASSSPSPEAHDE